MTPLGTFLFVGVWVHDVLELLFVSLCLCVLFRSVLSHWYHVEVIWVLACLFTTFLLLYVGHRGISRVYTQAVTLVVVYTYRFSVNNHVYSSFWVRTWCLKDVGWVLSVSSLLGCLRCLFTASVLVKDLFYFLFS